MNADNKNVNSLQSATIVLPNEDHTLGNALRYILVQDPRVDFVGYSIPHPTQKEVNLRLQTKQATALSVLDDGLDKLITMCDVLSESYKQTLVDYFKSQEKDLNLNQE